MKVAISANHEQTITEHLKSQPMAASLEQSLIAPVYETIITKIPKKEESKEDQILLWRKEAEKQFNLLIDARTNAGVVGFKISSLPDNFKEALSKRARAGIHHAFPLRDGQKKNKFETRAHSISLRFDQILEISDDSWDDIQGISYLVGFAPKEDILHNTLETHWVSLNTARLSVEDKENGIGKPSSFPVVVDPIPLSVMESAKLRQAILTFDNRNLFAMPGDPKEIENQGTNNNFHKFSQTSFPFGWKLPHLAYGSKLALYGYLSLHGGVIPENLRVKGKHPAKLPFSKFPASIFPNVLAEHDRPGYIGKQAVLKDYVHQIDYLRRVPVGSPRIDNRKGENGTLLSYPDSIKPLAVELDSTTSGITLKSEEDRNFLRIGNIDGGIIHLDSEEGLGFDLYQINPDFGEITLELIKPSSTDPIIFLTVHIAEGDKLSIETSINGLKITVPDPKDKDFSLRINLYKIFAYEKTELKDTKIVASICKIVASICLSKTAHLYFDADGWSNHIDAEGNIIQPCDPCSDVDCIKILDTWPQPLSPSPSLDHSVVKGGWLHISNTGEADINMQIPHVREIDPINIQKDDITISDIISVGGYGEKIILAQEDSSQTEIALLPVGFGSDDFFPQEIFKLRPPGLDFRSWAPAIVPVPTNKPVDTAGKNHWDLNHSEPDTSKYLNKAHKIVLGNEALKTKFDLTDKTFDDPYLDGFYVEVIILYQKDWTSNTQIKTKFFSWDSSTFSGFKEKFRHSGIPVSVHNSGDLTIGGDLTKAGGIKIGSENDGDILELRFYSAVREERYFNSNRDKQKFEPSLARGQKRLDKASVSYILSEPLKIRVERPTDEKIDTGSLYKLLDVTVNKIAPPQIHLRFKHDITDNTARKECYKLHHVLRYFQTYKLLPQRWYWFGRPLPSLGDKNLLLKSPQDKLEPKQLRNWEDIAYDGRDNSRVGIVASASLSRDHLPTITQNSGSFLHREILDYTGLAQYWRYAVEIESRYSLLTSKDLVVRAEIEEAESHDWKGLIIPGNIGREKNRKPIPRPSINLILPLTEALDADGQTGQSVIPPVLVIFDESFYEQGHIADRLDVIVEAVRHPLNDEPNLYQEAGPDPILSHKGLVPSIVKSDERLPILPVICEGIIGYTQSPLEESSDQRVAAAIISIDEVPFVQNKIDTSLWRQSTMAKLQLRRYHDPFLNDSGLKKEQINTKSFEFNSDGIGEVFYIAIPILGDALSHNITLTNSHLNLDARLVNILLTKEKESSKIHLSTDGKIKIKNTGDSNNLFKTGDLILPFREDEPPKNVILRLTLTRDGVDISNKATSLSITVRDRMIIDFLGVMRYSGHRRCWKRS